MIYRKDHPFGCFHCFDALDSSNRHLFNHLLHFIQKLKIVEGPFVCVNLNLHSKLSLFIEETQDQLGSIIRLEA